MKWIIIILFALVAIYFLVKSGNNKFWQLVNKNQLAAYDFFINNDCWFVIHPGEKLEKPSNGDWAGPFYIPIQGIGKLKIYGKKGEFERKQQEFIDNFEKA